MGGKNPYITEAKFTVPTQPYRITFSSEGKTIEVDPKKIPYGDDGLPGSILDIALAHDLALDHACGGVSACSTCHVYILKGMTSCNPAAEDEEDMLDNAPKVLIGKSRLGCQCVPDGTQDILVEIPSWNRNLAKEGPH
jgi:ferredoxin, 2Fe-2S